jgi:hypothetical protein
VGLAATAHNNPHDSQDHSLHVVNSCTFAYWRDGELLGVGTFTSPLPDHAGCVILTAEFLFSLQTYVAAGLKYIIIVV